MAHQLKLTTQNKPCLLCKLLWLALSFLHVNLLADGHIFVYHRFGESQHASTNTSIETLKAQFDYFKQHHYQVVPLSKLANALRKHQNIPDKWVVLTIDDSYKSFYTNALAIFKAYHYPFSLFVYVEATQKRYGDFMSWKQIKEASQYGEIGLHSYGHRHLVSLSKESIAKDTEHALDIFAKQLGFVPKYYAYPYGEYTPSIKKALKHYGFTLILNQNAGAVDKESDPYDLDRIALTGEVNLASKLAIQRLHVTWIEPLTWPKNGKLNTIDAKIAPTIKNVTYYVSGYGWKTATVHAGRVYLHPKLKLVKNRTRIFIKHHNRQHGIILVK